MYRNGVPWHPLHMRQVRGIPMHSYENRSQTRALWRESRHFFGFDPLARPRFEGSAGAPVNAPSGRGPGGISSTELTHMLFNLGEDVPEGLADEMVPPSSRVSASTIAVVFNTFYHHMALRACRDAQLTVPRLAYAGRTGRRGRLAGDRVRRVRRCVDRQGATRRQRAEHQAHDRRRWTLNP